jgi:hypothetical protein
LAAVPPLQHISSALGRIQYGRVSHKGKSNPEVLASMDMTVYQRRNDEIFTGKGGVTDQMVYGLEQRALQTVFNPMHTVAIGGHGICFRFRFRFRRINGFKADYGVDDWIVSWTRYHTDTTVSIFSENDANVYKLSHTVDVLHDVCSVLVQKSQHASHSCVHDLHVLAVGCNDKYGCSLTPTSPYLRLHACEPRALHPFGSLRCRLAFKYPLARKFQEWKRFRAYNVVLTSRLSYAVDGLLPVHVVPDVEFVTNLYSAG